MRLFRLEFSQLVNADLDRTWKFFSDPHNLPRITPPWLSFQLRSSPPHTIREGLLISYQVAPLFGLPLDWITEITKVDEGRTFIDEQRHGPYRIWHHEHTFTSVGTGVQIHDSVQYSFAVSPIDRIVNRVLVEGKIKEIFHFRAETVTKILAKHE